MKLRRGVLLMALTPGVLFATVAVLLQIADGMDLRPRAADYGVIEGIIAASFIWVFIGWLLLPLLTLVAWAAVRHERDEVKQKFWIATLVSMVGYVLLLEFMRMS
jgi:hypothetical protein